MPLYDCVIIGAGILGLATARQLLLETPDLNLLVIDKESRVAKHQSGHNSGVIHSGVYYKPGSLKAQLCVRGKHLLHAYCAERSIKTRRLGKVIVATAQDELPRLEALYERGQANGVEGIQYLSRTELLKREPYCTGGIAAVLCPEVAVVDFAEVCRSLAQDIRSLGGQLMTGFEVTKIDTEGSVVTLLSREGQRVQAKKLISCAGLFSDRIAAASGGQKTPKIVPFRGDYLLLKPSASYLVKGLIYPVPDPQFPFLGVHFTPRLDGSVWLGPNAVLAFKREGYRFADLSLKDLADVFSYQGFWRLAQKHWRVGLSELYQDLSKHAYVKALQCTMPALKASHCLPGPSGVRAQALAEDGSLVEDFVWDCPQENIIHLRNAPSPAATSCLAIAEKIAQKSNCVLV